MSRPYPTSLKKHQLLPHSNRSSQLTATLTSSCGNWYAIVQTCPAGQDIWRTLQTPPMGTVTTFASLKVVAVIPGPPPSTSLRLIKRSGYSGWLFMVYSSAKIPAARVFCFETLTEVPQPVRDQGMLAACKGKSVNSWMTCALLSPHSYWPPRTL